MDAIIEALGQLLPKGIVFDSPTIYAEVAKLPVVPLEDIHRHWKTYTRTHKSLHDPTACRLENFWWHVWGSDRRSLSGKTLATLWQQIASGPTFVPLRGPPNRWEPSLEPIRSVHESDCTQSQADRVANQPQDTESIVSKGTIYGLTPSSSRPPPAHTILKKPRGPSNSGPRPTARFVDVPDSEEEVSQPSGGNSVENSSKKNSDNRPSSSSISPAKVDRKPTPKKFVASSIVSKRRPVLPRRQSSQSSTGSVSAADPNPRDAASVSRNTSNQQASTIGSKDSSPSKRQNGLALSTHTEESAPRAKVLGKRALVPVAGRETASASSQDSRVHNGVRRIVLENKLSPVPKGNSYQENLPQPQGSSGGVRPSAKALGKRPEAIPVTPGRPVPTPRSINLANYDGSTGTQQSPPRSVPQSMQTSTISTGPADMTERSRKSAQEGSPRTGKDDVGSVGSNAAPVMARSRSNNESKRMSASSLKSPSVVGLSNIAVTGGFDFETPKARPSDDDLPPLGAGQPDIPAASLLDSRLRPTQPSPNAPPPLGRSKSQLTLVLERERARAGDRTKAGSTNSRKKDGSQDASTPRSRK